MSVLLNRCLPLPLPVGMQGITGAGVSEREGVRPTCCHQWAFETCIALNSLEWLFDVSLETPTRGLPISFIYSFQHQLGLIKQSVTFGVFLDDCIDFWLVDKFNYMQHSEVSVIIILLELLTQ